MFQLKGRHRVVYNVRKLQELPLHLALSDSWDDFHAHVACSVQWMVATCRCLGVTALLSQFTTMLSRDTEGLSDEQMKQKVKDILFVKTMINLSMDDIRRDPLSVPVQVGLLLWILMASILTFSGFMQMVLS